jgi:hypothetical protein
MHLTLTVNGLTVREKMTVNDRQVHIYRPIVVEVVF